MSGVAIGPLDGLGSPVVVTDVAYQLAGQVLNRGEYPARNNIALKLGEPVFDLVEPGRVGRRVVEVQSGVRREELLHPRGLMSRQVVRDNMHLLAARRLATRSARKATNSWLVCRAAVLPSTSPLWVLSAAYSES